MSTTAFLEHLTIERRYSVHTVNAYARDLGQFQTFLLEHGGKDKIEQALNLEVRTWLMKLVEQGISARTVRRKLSALRSYFRFMREAGLVDNDPCESVESPKMARRLPQFVEENKMGVLLNEIDFPEGYRGAFDKLVLELLYGTGIRLAELIGLKVSDVDIPQQTIRVLGKRNKERQIPLSAHLAELLAEFLAIRIPDNDGSLLVNEHGNRASRSLVQRRVAAYLGKVTTQSKKSPHVLRHSFATHLLNNGADLNAVKEILGHADLTATQVYTHNTIDKLKRVHAQAHPRGEKN